MEAQAGNARELGIWMLSSSPRTVIGDPALSNSGEWSRIVGALRLPSGMVVGADAASRELRFFAPTGELIATRGGVGEGPAEFRTMRPPMRCGASTVMVWDPNQGRVSVFEDTVFVDQFPISEAIPGDNGWLPWKVNCNDQGVLVGTSRRLPTMPLDGAVQSETRVVVTLPERAPVEVAVFSGDEFYLAQGSLAPRPLGRVSAVAVGRERVFVGDGQDGVPIRAFDFNGTSREFSPAPFERVAITSRTVDAFIDATVRPGPNSEAHRSFYEGLDYPDYLPAYAGFLVDADDNLWVEGFKDPAREGGVFWRAYGPTLDPLAEAQMPPGFRPMDIGADWILGVHRDELGVETLLLYDLVKRARSGAPSERHNKELL